MLRITPAQRRLGDAFGWRATQLWGACDDRIPRRVWRAHAGPRETRTCAARQLAAAAAHARFSGVLTLATSRCTWRTCARAPSRFTSHPTGRVIHVRSYSVACTCRTSNRWTSAAATSSKPRRRRRTLTMAVGPGMMGAAHAASAIKSTHGSGFCNLNIFLSHALQTAKEDGVELAVRQHADLRRAGDVPRHRPGRCRPDALHQLHRAVRRGRAGEDRRRRRHRGLRDRLAARPRLAPRSSRARRSAPSSSIRSRSCPTTG